MKDKCEFCSVEPGNIELMCNEEVDAKIGQLKNIHSLNFYVGKTTDGGLVLSTDYWMSDGGPVADIDIPIKYCPFCGREFPFNEKRVSFK